VILNRQIFGRDFKERAPSKFTRNGLVTRKETVSGCWGKPDAVVTRDDDPLWVITVRRLNKRPTNPQCNNLRTRYYGLLLRPRPGDPYQFLHRSRDGLNGVSGVAPRFVALESVFFWNLLLWSDDCGSVVGVEEAEITNIPLLFETLLAVVRLRRFVTDDWGVPSSF
jgi:hypothetical protein